MNALNDSDHPGSDPSHGRRGGRQALSYRRLLRLRDRLRQAIATLPARGLPPSIQKRLRTQFKNRLIRVERALGLRVPRPPVKPMYSIGEAATMVGASNKTLIRRSAAGLIPCQRIGGIRYFLRQDLLTAIKSGWL